MVTCVVFDTLKTYSSYKIKSKCVKNDTTWKIIFVPPIVRYKTIVVYMLPEEKRKIMNVKPAIHLSSNWWECEKM